MDLQQLRALVSVAEAGSVTEAARRLLLTQPAVTKQIRALEEELGGALFDRTTKPIRPTALGKTALAHARRILQLTEDLRALVSSQAGTLRGELRVGVAFSLARLVGPALVVEIGRLHPGLQLFVTSNWSRALAREVEDGSLDAAVVLAPPHVQAAAGLVAARLAPQPVALVSSTSEPFRGTVPVEALRGTRWVLNPEGCGYRALLRRTLEGAGIPFTVAVEVADIEIQLELIARGVGLGIIPRRALPPAPEAAGLRPFRLRDVDFSVEARMIHRRAGPILPAVASAIEQIVSSLLTRAVSGRKGERPSGLEGGHRSSRLAGRFPAHLPQDRPSLRRKVSR